MTLQIKKVSKMLCLHWRLMLKIALLPKQEAISVNPYKIPIAFFTEVKKIQSYGNTKAMSNQNSP